MSCKLTNSFPFSAGEGSPALEGDVLALTPGTPSTTAAVARTGTGLDSGGFDTVGVAMGKAESGLPVNVLRNGVGKVRVEAGLTFNVGSTLWTSGTVDGAATNVPPVPARPIVGIVIDFTDYTPLNPFVIALVAIEQSLAPTP